MAGAWLFFYVKCIILDRDKSNHLKYLYKVKKVEKEKKGQEEP